MFWNNDIESSVTPTGSLVEACSQEDIPMVKQLIQTGADMNSTSELKFSALNMAVFRNNTELILILLAAGANINFQKNDKFGLGETPLISAVGENNSSIVKLLLDHGANPNITGSFRRTPLILAAEKGALEAAKVLLEYGVPIEHGVRTDFYTKTALCVAVLHNQTEMATFLIKNKAKTKPLRKLPRNKINPKMVKWLKQRKYL